MRSERFSCCYSECFYDNGTEPLARALFPARVPRLVSSHPSCFSSMLSPAPSCTSLFYSLYSTRFCLKLPSEFFIASTNSSMKLLRAATLSFLLPLYHQHLEKYLSCSRTSINICGKINEQMDN